MQSDDKKLNTSAARCNHSLLNIDATLLIASNKYSNNFGHGNRRGQEL